MGTLLRLLVLLLFCASCGGLAARPDEVNSWLNYEQAVASEEQSRQKWLDGDVPVSSEAHYSFLLGEIAVSADKLDEAALYYEDAARLEPNAAPTLRQRLAQLYIRQKKLDQALGQIDLILQSSPEDVESLELKAGLLATLKRTDEAIEVYRKIIALSGSAREEPYVFAASLYLQDDNKEKARELLQQMLAAHPNSFFAHFYLARVAEATGDYAVAEKEYKKSLELSPNADAVRLELARMYGTQKRFAEALAICDAIIAKNPKLTEARNLRAQLLVGKEDINKAIAEFEALSKLEEDPSKTRFRLAVLKLQRRDFAGAETDLNLVLAEYPDHAAARYYLASVYVGQNRIDEARAQLEGIKEDSDIFLDARLYGAMILSKAGRAEDARAFVQRVVELRPEDVKVLSLYAGLQRDAGNLEGAIATMQKVIGLEPQVDRHYFSLGVYYDENSRQEEAIATMRQAIAINPKNSFALNYLGYTLTEQGQNYQEAEEFIKRALVEEPNNGYYMDSLAWVYYRTGRYKEALVEMQRALKIVTTDSVLFEHLAQIYRALGQKEKSRQAANKALEFVEQAEDKQVKSRVEQLIHELDTP